MKQPDPSSASIPLNASGAPAELAPTTPPSAAQFATQLPPDKAQRIVQAAMQLFADKGFHGTAVPEVAKLAGVAAGTIYRYFDSKEALVNAVFQHAKQALRQQLLDGLDIQQPPRALFHEFWLRLTQFARQQPIAFRFLELQDHVPYLNDASRNLELSVLAPIWAYCQSVRPDPAAQLLASPAVMAMIWGAIVGLFKAQHLGYLTLDDNTLRQAEDACWALFSSATPAEQTAHQSTHQPKRDAP